MKGMQGKFVIPNLCAFYSSEELKRRYFEERWEPNSSYHWFHMDKTLSQNIFFQAPQKKGSHAGLDQNEYISCLGELSI